MSNLSLTGSTWFFKVYSEHFPHGLKDIVKCLQFDMCAISPEHNKDKLEDGSPKKPHYHIVIAFNHRRSIKSVISYLSEIFKDYGGCNCGQFDKPNSVTLVGSKFAVDNYLIHKFNEDKYHYNENDIVCLNGYVAEVGAPAIVSLIAICQLPEVQTFRDLVDWVMKYDPEKLSIVFKNSYTLRSYLS